MPGWLSWLRLQLMISTQVVISESWDLALCWTRYSARSLLVSLSNFWHSVPLLSLIIPLTISYIPCMSETIWWLSFSNWLTSFSIIPSRFLHVEANSGYSFLTAEPYPIVHIDHSFSIHHPSMDTEAPSTVWLLWTLLLETSGCRCPGVSLHLYLWGKSNFSFLFNKASEGFIYLVNSFKESTPGFVDLFYSSSGLYFIEFCSNLYNLSSPL